MSDSYVTEANCTTRMDELEAAVQELVSLGEGTPEIELEVEVFGMTAYPTDKTLSIEDMAADAKAVGDAIGDLETSIADVYSDMYPVGSIYMTTANSLPQTISAIGTWAEIAMPLTLKDIKIGTRHFEETDNEFVPGTVHLWLRTA